MRLLLLAAAAASLGACVSTNAAVLDPTVRYQRTCAAGVRIYTSAARVPADYYEVALLHSKGESGWTDERQMMASQRSKAAELGANGIILGDIREPNAGTKILGSLLGTGSERQGKAIAVYIPSDSARAQRACTLNQGQTAQDDRQGTPAHPFAGPPNVSRPATPEAAAAEPAPTAPSPPAPSGATLVRVSGGQTSGGVVEARAVQAGSASQPVHDAPPVVEAQHDRPGLPVGTRWIVSVSQKMYYPVGCPAADVLSEEDKLYYDNEDNPRSAGFKRSIVC